MKNLKDKIIDNKGFTLVELVVVIAILAILGAIALPKYMEVRNNAKKDADYTTIASIAKAAELYYIKYDEVPSVEKLVEEGYLSGSSIKLQSVDVDLSADGVVTIEIDLNSVKVTVDGTDVQYPDDR